MRRAAALVALALLSCAAPPRGGGEVLVLTSFQPLFSLAAEVAEGSPSLRVENLAPRALGPHDFDPEDHAGRCEPLVRRADAVVTLRSLPLGMPFDGLFAWCRARNVRIVEVDPAAFLDPPLPLILDPGGAPNPHVWLSPAHAERMAERIAGDFAALDPGEAARYRRNAEGVRARLRALRTEFERRLAAVEAPAVASLTEGFPYLAAAFGVDVVDRIPDPSGPEEVARRVRDADVRVVWAEEEPAGEVRAAVEDAGAKLVVLSTIEEGWGEGEALRPEGYLEALRANLEALAAAFGG